MRAVKWQSLSEPERDEVIAEYCLDCLEEGMPRQSLVTLVAALHKICPRERYKIASAVLLSWSAQLPPKQAPAVPREFCGAMCVILLLLGRVAEGTLLRLCFTALLRISEGLNLRWRDVMLPQAPDEPLVLLLGQTKRGRDQRVVVTDPLMIYWLLQFASRSGGTLHDRVFETSYGRVRRLLPIVSGHLGLQDVGFTTHSFRRGGASHLLERGTPIMNIAEYGRWAGEGSCKEYLRKGEVFVLRLKASLQPPVLKNIVLLDSLSAKVWEKLC